MKTNMSKHAYIDRFDRISAIVELFNGDLGETLIRVWDEKYNNYQELTTKGVVIARGEDGTVVTMFLCNIRRAKFFGATSGVMLTRNQWKRIQDNQKYAELCA